MAGVTGQGNVSNILENLSYGKGPEESVDIMKKWIKEHEERSFSCYIKGEWITPEGSTLEACKDRKTLETLTNVSVADSSYVNSNLLPSLSGSTETASWSVSHWQRSRCLYSFAQNLQTHQWLTMVIETLISGTNISHVCDVVIPYAVKSFYHYAGWAMLKNDELAQWKPKGVVAVIVDEKTSPLFAMCQKICPALAMGNTVVVIPSPQTSLIALLLAEICSISGFPKGVFNVVPMCMSTVPPDLKVDKVCLCGSFSTNVDVIKKLCRVDEDASLSLGCSVSTVVFESSDLSSAAVSVTEILCNQIEQMTRNVFVQEEVFEKFWDLLCAQISKVRVGSCVDKSVDVTPNVDFDQVEKMKELLGNAIQEGARVVSSSKGENQSYCPLTIVRDVQTSSRIVVEVVGAPLAVILPFRTAKEAITLVNKCRYRHTVSIWTEKLPLALEVGRLVKAATVWINTQNLYDPAASFGGSQKLGNSKSGGKECLFEYLKPDLPKHLFDSGATAESNSSCSTFNAKTITERVDITYKLYYGGAQKRPDGNSYRPAPQFSDGGEQFYIPVANAKDLHNAVMSAQSAQPGWEKRSGHSRAQILYYVAENLQRRKEEFQKYLDVRKATSSSYIASSEEVDYSIQRLFYWAAYCDKHGGDIKETGLYGTVMQLKEAVGVVGIICPKEYPLLAFVSLFAAAVACGNTVVIVPSEECPIPALNMYQILNTSDVPPGVANIISGCAKQLCYNMMDHLSIDSVWCHASEIRPITAKQSENATRKRLWFAADGRDWTKENETRGEFFFPHSTNPKTIWMPVGDIFAN